MREFQISRYMKKWLPFIVLICTVSTVLIYLFLSAQQTYVASAVIQFNGAEAEEGLTPLGTELDVNEIKSSAIMSRVLDNLALGEQSYSVDDLISRIKTFPVLDEDEQATKDAAIENGEEYTYEPTRFIVSFEAKSDEGEGFARQVLDETLDVYFSEYSEKYVNTGSTVNALRNLTDSNYDYIEMMEIIEDNIADTVQTLNGRSKADPYYRSTATGKSFADLGEEFYFIQSVELSQLYSEILENQITKNKNLLISNYTERINTYNISNRAEEKKIKDVLELIDAYVEKMRNSGNTNITYEYILDEVYEKNLVDTYGDVIGNGDQTVTYDKLIYSWRDHNVSKEEALIDAAYCNYIIEAFSSCKGLDEEACVLSDETCMQKNSFDYEKEKQKVEESIRKLVDKLEEVYAQADLTNVEYNEYVGAANISVLSTVSVEESLKVVLFTGIAAVFLMIVCCMGAVLIGRMDDIIQYVFYTDHMTGLYNRASFDSYLNRNGKRLLNKGTAIATVTICNQIKINQECGREEGDRLIQFIAEAMKEEFGRLQSFMVYNGNAQFIVIVQKTDAESMHYMLEHFRLTIEKRDILTETEVVYEMGMAETEKDDVYRIRGLLSKAYRTQEKYHA